ncbi:MarR family winged helix-turn-helix transcriptional regulator [Microbacterium sp. RU33B]|uniref:MarR family winged helix-turn-helix transcriptional regulator n=1 Tax=Microbacterium sp. RU33B TaxID=1907390 RepID=UPI00096727E6|nr:MarR family transcriptional regulator [Microbacterium sp. RU33B]SIT72008.1 DNA-binding transcriptional regulator, MarR family [Microbacterium sp. RU33B]
MQTTGVGSSGAEADSFAPTRAPTALLREFIDLSEQFERSIGAELDVNPTDLQAMEHLLMGGPLGPTELARRVGISTGATTTVIDRLVALGHVTREPHPTDRRGVLVVPQAASRARALSRLMPMIMGIDAELDTFSPEEQETIARYLDQVVARLRQHIEQAEGPDGP